MGAFVLTDKVVNAFSSRLSCLYEDKASFTDPFKDGSTIAMKTWEKKSYLMDIKNPKKTI